MDSKNSRSKNYGSTDSLNELDINQGSGGWFSLSYWFNWSWCPTSMSLLRAAEKRILSYVKTPYRGHYVNIGPVVGKEDCKVWTLSLNETSKKVPLVMVHGLGSGVALWALNLDGLADARPVHAFDMLGFGRSSRPYFSKDAMEAERELVNSIEEWRKEMDLEEFSLMGHSMGGFLATSYAIRFPKRVSHLILCDPWGFPERPTDLSTRYPIPIWVKVIAYVLQPLNPLWGIRLAGPMGPKLIEKARPDLIKKFSHLTDGGEGDSEIASYIFHCNSQNPTGESAFHAMMSAFGWAKFPMCNRISSLHKNVPLTMIYGSRSWVEHFPGEVIKKIRSDSYVNIHEVHGAGHHVYADKKEEFNSQVLQACELADKKVLGTLSSPEVFSTPPDIVSQLNSTTPSSEEEFEDTVVEEKKNN